MAKDLKKYVDSVALKTTLVKYLAQTDVRYAKKAHKHLAEDITNFADAVKNVVTAEDSTLHKHDNKEELDKITSGKVDVWDAKIGTADVARLGYTSTGMSGVDNVKAALDVLVANVQMVAQEDINNKTNMQTLKANVETRALKTDLDAEVQARKAADETIDGKITILNGDSTVQGSVDQKIAKAITDNGLGNLGDYVKDEVDKVIAAQTTRITALEEDVERIDGAETVEGSFRKEVKVAKEALQGNIDAEKTARENADTGLSSRITNLENLIGGGGGDITGTIGEEISKLKEADTKLEGLITAEKERAEGAEGVLAGRLDVIEGEGEGSIKKALADAKTYADTKDTALKKDLQAEIKTERDRMDTFMAAAEIGGAAIDTLKEIQDYINTHGTAAAEMLQKIGKNETAIANIKTEIGTKAVDGGAAATGIYKLIDDEVTALEQVDNAIKGRLNIIEGGADVDGSIEKALADAKAYADSKDTDLHTTISAEIDSKVKVVADKLGEKNDADTVDTAFGRIAKEIKDREAADTTLSDRITALEGITGDAGSIDTRLDAIEAEIGKANDATDKTPATIHSRINKEIADRASEITRVEGKADAAKTAADNAQKYAEGVNTLLGTKADTSDKQTAFGFIQAEEERAIAAEGDLNTRISDLEASMNNIQIISDPEIDAIISEVFADQLQP